MTRRIAAVLAAAVVVGACGDGRSLPGEPSTAADSAISRGISGAGLTGSLELCAADGIAPVARRQSAAFMRRYDNARITVSTATARECVASLASGRYGATLLDRPLNDEERAALEANRIPFSEIRMGTGALALVAQAGSSVRSLRLSGLQRLLQGQSISWTTLADSASGPLPTGAPRLVLAHRNAGAVEVLTTRMLSPGTMPRPTHAVETEEEVIDWVAATPGAIGVVSLAVLKADTSGRVRLLAVPDSTGRPVHPTQMSIAQDRYPLPQPLVLVVVGGRGPLGASFATFARGNPGQEAVLRAGLLPVRRPVREIVLD